MINPFPGNEEFIDLVNKDARNNISDGDANWLRSPDIVEAWRDQIILLLNRVDVQLSHHKAERTTKYLELYDPKEPELYIQYSREAKVWKANTLWFKKTLLDRLAEAKTIIRELTFEEVAQYNQPGAETQPEMDESDTYRFAEG